MLLACLACPCVADSLQAVLHVSMARFLQALWSLARPTLVCSRSLALRPLQKSYVYFEVGTANKSTSMDKEDLASPFWSDTVTFDDVPSDLAEESIKVQ